SSERFRSHRALRTLLERLAATRPVVLALDDVHWADSSTVEVIGALLRRPPAARLLVALAYRPHQAPARLRRELTAAAADGVLDRIELRPLSQTDAEQLLVGREVSRRDRDVLFRESGGNPFYLHQLARTAGRARARTDLGAGVPTAVAASLLAELEGVSRVARLLARAAAVAGDPFDPHLAADVAELDHATALAALDELVGADLVHADERAVGFAFRHPLVRRAIYESARPGWRIGAHARADAAMARRGDPAAARAHHVERSAAVGDADAIELLVSAATTAIVPANAARWLRAALRLAPAGGAQQLGLLCSLGEALAAAGLLEESRAALMEALALWPDDGDANGRVALVVVCAIVERLLGRHEQARARLAAATDELDDLDCPAGVALAIEVATERVFSTDFATVREAAARAERAATVVGDPLLRAVAVTIAGVADYCARDLTGARRRVSAANDLVAALDDAALAVRPDLLFSLGWAELFLDRHEPALRHFDHGVTVARASGHSQLYVELTVGRAYALVGCGRLTEAQAAAEEAVEAARLSENPQPLAWALGSRCVTNTDRGDLPAAIRDGREAVALAIDGSSVSATSGVTLAVALAEGGDWEDVVDLILTSAGGADLPRTYPGIRAEVYETMTRAEIGLGRVEHAAEWARRAGAAAAGLGCDLAQSHADRAAAHVLLARGDAITAARRALRSAQQADTARAPVDAGRSRLVAGRALIAAGDRERAGENLRTAEGQLASCGALRLRDECVRELRRIGLRIARAGVRGDRGARGPASLSGREREVADLVRARHTNREIARLLFLSEKTVESHLRSVFVKLGVTSRANAARMLDAIELETAI
ncbi:MAG: hypothetical protein QOJ35_1994, partial [Solirubrobacteraceae bacterium]|nr:hypothetical protein [Solirubrobacteraceae bacterium]